MKKTNDEEKAAYLFFARIGIVLGLLCFLMAYIALTNKPNALTTGAAIFTIMGFITFLKGIDFFMKS